MAAPGVNIAVANLVADGFRLELPRADGPVDRLTIARAVELHGGYQQGPGHIQLQDIAADELLLDDVHWHWPGGQIRTSATATLQAPHVAADIALGELRGRTRFTGRISVAKGATPKLELTLREAGIRGDVAFGKLAFQQGPVAEGAHVESAELVARALAVSVAAARIAVESLSTGSLHLGWRADGAVDARVGRLELRGVSVLTGTLRVKVGAVVAASARVVRSANGELRVETGRLLLEGVDLALGAVAVRLDRVEVPSGLVWSGSDLKVGQLAVDSVSVRAVVPSATEPRSGQRPGPSVADLRFLDGLDGKIEVDLTVDAKVPFIVRRVATHEFRIPVQGGKIDYRRLERDLSMLEDALLDFAVRDGRLVLETNVPLSPFRGQPLVYWPLDGDDLTFARHKHLVRLRTLFDYRLPEKTKRARRAGQSSAFELNRLDFENLILDLRLAGPGALDLGDAGSLRLGSAERPAIERLTATGDVRYRTGQSAKPTTVRFDALSLLFGLDRLRVGTLLLSADEIGIGAVDAGAVQLSGARPTEVGATLKAIAIRDLRMAFPSRAPPQRRSKAHKT